MAHNLVEGCITILGRQFWASHSVSKKGYLVLRTGNPIRADDRSMHHSILRHISFETINKLFGAGIDLSLIANSVGQPREFSADVFCDIVDVLD